MLSIALSILENDLCHGDWVLVLSGRVQLVVTMLLKSEKPNVTSTSLRLLTSPFFAFSLQGRSDSIFT